MPSERHKKLKLYVDINVPDPLVIELRTAGLILQLARDWGPSGRRDKSISQEARRLGLVLLTMDEDFWQDKKYLLETTAGVIYVCISPDEPERAVDGIARFYALFGKYYPLDWWKGTKARVYEHGFIIRTRTWKGRVTEEEFRLSESGKLFTRVLK
jgi:hypothetical protein